VAYELSYFNFVDVDMLQNFEAPNQHISGIEHRYEQPNFVFLPDGFHDKIPSQSIVQNFSCLITILSFS
jgi:hypothetical protein